MDNKIANDFFKMYEDKLHTQFKLTWMGYQIIKCPFDLWNYQEILFSTQPDVLIECGTHKGGSALYFANIFDVISNGVVISVDINLYDNRPIHDRIKYYNGSSVDDKMFNDIKNTLTGDSKVMVVLDSDHSKKHVLKEMEMYSDIVTLGCYMIVEDGCVNGHPVFEGWGDGPYEAINEFLKKDDRFIIDKEREEKFLMTYHPNGWLKKII